MRVFPFLFKRICNYCNSSCLVKCVECHVLSLSWRFDRDFVSSVSMGRGCFCDLLGAVSKLLFPVVAFPCITHVLVTSKVKRMGFCLSVVGCVSVFTKLKVPACTVHRMTGIGDSIGIVGRITIRVLLLRAFLALLKCVMMNIMTLAMTRIRIGLPLFLVLDVGLFFVTVKYR